MGAMYNVHCHAWTVLMYDIVDSKVQRKPRSCIQS